MGRVGYDDPPALLVLAAVGEIRVHEHEARQLPLGAGGGSDTASRPQTSARISCKPHELERALCPILVLQRMEIDEPGEPRRDLVHARVVLHRADPADRSRCPLEVPRRQGREVADELGLEISGSRGGCSRRNDAGISGDGRS